MKLKPSIWIVAVTAAIAGIWGAQSPILAAGAAPARRRQAAASTGTVTGTIRFEGQKPPRPLINMSKDPECARENEGRDVYVEDGEVNANGTLPNVFVYVKSIPAGATGMGAVLERMHRAVQTQPVVLDQQGCVFVPHVLGVMVAQRLKILNSDFTLHNVHVTPKLNAEWNESQPPGGAPVYETFSHPEIMIPVSCNEHPWMRAYIGVVSNPFYDVTGTKGTFTLKGLPPGQYTIEAWTATFGTKEQTVRVEAGRSTAADFTFTHE